MYHDRLSERTDSEFGARRHGGALLDVNPATLRNWSEAEDRAARPVPASGVVETAEVRELRGENAELRKPAPSCLPAPQHGKDLLESRPDVPGRGH